MSKQDDVAAFRQAVGRQMELIREGMSHSGRERNCCFLNCGDSRFANISAVAGLDHIGDGRAYALCDWDHDGDIDIWATNRTAPRVQFLRNNGTPGNHFLALKLRGDGTTVNRDAIGARVEVVLQSEGDNRLIKSLYAGNGFLSQSSKNLTFGLGTAEVVERVIVQWPGGPREEFTGFKPDRHYLIVQGNGLPRPRIRPGGAAEIVSVTRETSKDNGQQRIPLRYRVPLPPIEYEDLVGQVQNIDLAGGKPTLLTLWASWCQPCMRELVDIRKHESELRSRDVNVLALSVDKLAEDATSNPDAARAFLERQDFPFESGFATEKLLRTVDAIHQFLYGVQNQTTVPTSFLYDKQGRLSVIYVGRVSVEDLLKDIDNLAMGDLPWFQEALPYAGTWIGRPPQPDLTALVDAFVDRKLAKEAQHYFDRYSDVLSNSSKLPNLLVQLGSRYGQQGDVEGAIDQFLKAVEQDPENAAARFQLAKAYLLKRRFSEALHHFQAAAELKPDFTEAHFMLATLYSHLDQHEQVVEQLEKLVELEPSSVKNLLLLGGAYMKSDRWSEAAEKFRKAVRLAPDMAEVHYHLGVALEGSGRAEEAARAFATAGKLKPENARRQFGLAIELANAGNIEGAIKQFRMAHRLDPDSPFIANGLAWMLVSKENPDQYETAEAVRLAKQAVEATQGRQPQMLDTLGAAFAVAGDFDQAVSTAEKAIELSEKLGDKPLADEIRTRLQHYQRQEKYQPPAQ